MSDNDFALVVTQLRPAADGEPKRASELIDGDGDDAAIAQTPAQAPVSEVCNDPMGINCATRGDSRLRSPGPPSNFKFFEFVRVWKSLGQQSAGAGTSKRSLNVLGWGFEE